VQSKCPKKSEAGNPRAVAMERLLVNTYQWQAENQVISEEAIERNQDKKYLNLTTKFHLSAS